MCNDGEPAVYLSRKLPGDPKVWAINFEGGGWCWDERSCRERCSESDPLNYSCSSELLYREGHRYYGVVERMELFCDETDTVDPSEHVRMIRLQGSFVGRQNGFFGRVVLILFRLRDLNEKLLLKRQRPPYP